MVEVGNGLRVLRRALVLAAVVYLSGCGGGKEAATASADAAAQASPQVFKVGTESFLSAPCASEGGTCTFVGEQNVAFGAGSQFVVKRFVNNAHCERATFGTIISMTGSRCFLAAAVAIAGSGAISPPPAAASTPISQPLPVVNITGPISNPEAARFLVQATFGPTLPEINRLAKMGYGAWLDEQFAALPMDSHWEYYRRRGQIGCNPCTSYFLGAVMESFWTQAIRGQDQLRQRLAFALSEIFVISTVNNSLETVTAAHAGYLDMLDRNVFANYRTLLEQVARSPAMGKYLSHMHNEKEDPASGRLPDENFAREVMQLFSIGLWELNEDGSRKKDGAGNDIPTYTQADIMGMAKVFTGLGWGNEWDPGFTGANPNDQYERAYNLPMQMYADHHSTSEKRILRGVVIPANTSGNESLKIALDTLYNHPNVGPFIGSQLIKRLVTSNPSPAYIKRVAQAFNDNGSGVRGDMKAVVRAILLDPEARDAAKITDPQWGKLREPMVRYANFLRAFNASSISGAYRIHELEDTLASIGQNPLRAPSVFNWFRPDYSPPGDLVARGLVAPEFQITHETTTTGYANFMANAAEQRNTWFRDHESAKWGPVTEFVAVDYSAEMALSNDPNALLDRLNLLLMSGQMSAPTRKAIVDAVNATPADANEGQLRVAFAVYLIMISPEFIVQK